MRRYVNGFGGFVDAMNEGNADWERKRARVDAMIEDGVRPSDEMLRKGWIYDEQNPELDYESAICYIREFNYGQAVIDVTPFREGLDELRPRAWIDGNEIDVPEAYTIKGPKLEEELIRNVADKTVGVVDEEIRSVIASTPNELDLWMFGGDGYESKQQDVQDVIDYFDGRVDWHPRLKKIVRGKNMFGL